MFTLTVYQWTPNFSWTISLHSNRAHHNTKHRGGYEKTAESFGVKRLFLTFNGKTLISNTNSTLKQAFKGEKNYEFNVNMLSVVK